MKQGVGYKISQKTGLLHNRKRLLANMLTPLKHRLNAYVANPRYRAIATDWIAIKNYHTPKAVCQRPENCPEHAVTASPFLLRPWLRFRQFPAPGFHFLTEPIRHFGIAMNEVIPFTRIIDNIK